MDKKQSLDSQEIEKKYFNYTKRFLQEFFFRKGE